MQGRWRQRQHTLGAAAAAVLLLSMPATAAPRGGRVDPFDALAGAWSGDGMVAAKGRVLGRLQCRAAFTPAGSSTIRMMLRCTSGGYALQVASDIERSGRRFAGRWTETGTGIRGSLAGSASTGHLRGVVEGLGIAAALSLDVRGDIQSVLLVAPALAGRAAVTLRRG